MWKDDLENLLRMGFMEDNGGKVIEIAVEIFYNPHG
jgi:hypothetical protein